MGGGGRKRRVRVGGTVCHLEKVFHLPLWPEDIMVGVNYSLITHFPMTVNFLCIFLSLCLVWCPGCNYLSFFPLWIFLASIG